MGTRATLRARGGRLDYFSLAKLEKSGLGSVSELPFAVKILLESMLRHVDGFLVREEDLSAALSPTSPRSEIPFMPARVIMQDFTGVPAVADLAAMRDAVAQRGGDPEKINPSIPVDLVIDHSVQVDRFASRRAFAENNAREYGRNRERYQFLRWGASAFRDFRVVPPATGIVHQVNLELLARVVQVRDGIAFPDSVVGTDSHTTMINGIGVLGWGVGGIEAEAALLGQPMYMLLPEVVGMRLQGRLRDGVTATDLVLTVTQMLRSRGVVEKIVEFFGPGASSLAVSDRATVANMSPEYGATAGFFPVDEKTISYLRDTGRDADLVDIAERYCREQGLFRDAGAEPGYSDVVELDLGSVEPCVAGPRRPQDRIPLSKTRGSWHAVARGASAARSADVEVMGARERLRNGSVVIAAITSCTNTSNPSVMIGAGLLARNAVQLGLRVPAYVKTSLAPGSRAVTRYLDSAGLTPYLEALGFHLVGYGCTTCIGNSGPLPEEVSKAVAENDLTVAAVLSGNRNFEGRIHPSVRASYLASPPLVVAFALAGTMDIDLVTEPLGTDHDGSPVYLRDVWPAQAEIEALVRTTLGPDLMREAYQSVFEGNELWKSIDARPSSRYPWQESSTYIRRPPFFDGLPAEAPGASVIARARVLALLGDSVTTDHISPAGEIPANGPAARWLKDHGVPVSEFNTFGARRGNHDVMIRGTLGNIRLRNALVPGAEGGLTRHIPSGEEMPIFEAAQRYRSAGIPLLIIAGKEYGTGSSRDWAAKGTLLLGVRAVIAESFERIHRSNLIGMGVLPLQFEKSQNAGTLGLTGEELYSIEAPEKPGDLLAVVAEDLHGYKIEFVVRARIDTDIELTYYRNGGILPTVLRERSRQKNDKIG
ncbi:MAG TPA: aconitate hydratase AcnA [Spirochaetia bacterium]|nr:aconitate hydratase AcnA [Spirochaetia bacterium]